MTELTPCDPFCQSGSHLILTPSHHGGYIREMVNNGINETGSKDHYSTSIPTQIEEKPEGEKGKVLKYSQGNVPKEKNAKH